MEHEIGQDPKVAFAKVYQKALSMGLSDGDLLQLESLEYLRTTEKKSNRTSHIWTVLAILLALLVGVVCFDWPITKQKALQKLFFQDTDYLEDEKCLVDHVATTIDLFRPATKCDVCRNMYEVDRVSNITPKEFEEKYAYSKRPVVITDGTKNWTAPDVFNFSYFRGLYQEGSPALESTHTNCQFFPYKTEFETLGEVFAMSDERANLKDGTPPWYIGWSNCDPEVATELRTHYKKPYFLPQSSESRLLDWIFMGSPGYGAFEHVDNVKHPSWQAQLTGQKVWTLKPPSECYLECPRELKVTINPGEIIVIDTNTWYHSTLVTGNEISIVIGSEYD